MPIYMDYHITPGASAKDVAQAHAFDVEHQDEYDCRAITYWMDENRGTVFCLFDAPDKESVIKLHNSTHGFVPHEIIDVNSQVVEAFLGRLHDPEGYYELSNPNLRIINDPAFRIIMVTQTEDERLIKNKLGAEKTIELLSLHHNIVREQVQKFEGREAELGNDGFVVSFVSVMQAIDCAFAIRKSLHVAAEFLKFKIGIHAGIPVNKSNRIFGRTIDFARYLCSLGNDNQILLSSVVKSLFKEDKRKHINGRNDVRWLTPSEETFLQSLLDTLKIHSDKSEFDVPGFCSEMNISKPQLYRKCKSLTGMSPNEVLREYRLNNSLELLKNDNQNISQITYEIGFNSPSYFSKCFQKRFGIQPLSYFKQSF